MPCDSLLKERLSMSSAISDCPSMSMNPGETTRPVASTTFRSRIFQVSNLRDSVSAKRNISRSPWIPCAIDNPSILDDDVVLVLRIGLREHEHGTEGERNYKEMPCSSKCRIHMCGARFIFQARNAPLRPSHDSRSPVFRTNG